MVGINAAKYKLMPTSPDVDLKKVEEDAKKIVSEFGGTQRENSIEPVAFGLKSLTIFFSYPDNLDTEGLEEKFAVVENVASAQLIDMRKIA